MPAVAPRHIHDCRPRRCRVRHLASADRSDLLVLLRPRPRLESEHHPWQSKGPVSVRGGKVPQTEPDVGFKEFIFEYQNHYVRIVEHASTAMGRRVCARFHTMYVMVYDSNGNEKYRSGFKADFGAAVGAEDQSTLTGNTCGYSMEAVRVATNAFRRIRRDADSGNYEVWRTVPTSGTTNLGLVLHHTLDIRDPYSFCPTQNCAEVEIHHPDRRQTETRRTLQMRNFEIRANYALDTGTYYTDPFGDGLVAANAPNAVQQYVAPGFNLIFPTDDFRCEVDRPVASQVPLRPGQHAGTAYQC